MSVDILQVSLQQTGKVPCSPDSSSTAWVSAVTQGPRVKSGGKKKTRRGGNQKVDMDLRSELLKSIWYGFTALDLEKSGKVSKSQLKVSRRCSV